jgi:hypothetical protein
VRWYSGTENTLESETKAAEDRRCVLCTTTFAQSYGNKRQPIRIHYERHFPGTECDGACGDFSCTYTGSKKALYEHRTRSSKTCTVCAKRFPSSTALRTHAERKHVQKFQYLSTALNVRLGIGSLGTSPPWMNGPSSVPERSVHSQLAEDVTDAVLALLKPDPLLIEFARIGKESGGDSNVQFR